MNQLVQHKGKWYIKSDTGYREVLATTDSSLNLTSMLEANISGFKAPNLWLIPQSFVSLFIDKYNKGEQIKRCMVEYNKAHNYVISEYKGKKVMSTNQDALKLNGNEIIISECEEKLSNKEEMKALLISIGETIKEYRRNKLCDSIIDELEKYYRKFL